MYIPGISCVQTARYQDDKIIIHLMLLKMYVFYFIKTKVSDS